MKHILQLHIKVDHYTGFKRIAPSNNPGAAPATWPIGLVQSIKLPFVKAKKQTG